MTNKVNHNLDSVFGTNQLNADIVDYSLPTTYNPPVPEYKAQPAPIVPTQTTEVVDDDSVLPDVDITPYIDKKTLS